MFALAVTAVWFGVFFKTVPQAFIRLAEQRGIDENEKGNAKQFVDDYTRWLNHPARFLNGAAFAVVGLALDYFIVFGSDLSRLLPGREPAAVGAYATEVWLTNWINGAGIVLALFVGGTLMFKVMATALLIHRAPRYFDFDIQPSHPDHCGGFKSVGDLCLKMVYIPLVPALFLSFWLIVSKHITFDLSFHALLPPYMLDVGFRTPAKILLALLAVTGAAVFFWPMYSLHELMLEEKGELQRTLDAIARRIHTLNRATLADPTMPADDRKKSLADIDSLKDLYDRTNKAPAWPFERVVAIKFATTQFFPLLSLLGLGSGTLGGLLEILLKGI